MKQATVSPEVLKETLTVLTEILLEIWKEGKVLPTRKYIVNRMRKQGPYSVFCYPTLELEVAKHLNHLVDVGIVSRINGKHYIPGERYHTK